MAKIVISDLHHHDDVETFLHDLTSTQANTVWGGATYIYITNVSDSVNSPENTVEGANSYNFRDNKIYTVDYSRSNYNWIYVR